MSEAQKLLQPALQGNSKRYAAYSGQIYLTTFKTSQAPEVPTIYDELDASAKARLKPEAYAYCSGGAGMEMTMRANREAFDHV